MRTSAGIGLHFEKGLQESLRHAVAVESTMRAVAGGAFTLLLGAVCAFVLVVAGADHRSACDDRRDREGYGRAGALYALAHPDAQSRFLYRVASDPEGYLVRVVVNGGEWVGDTWEQDATGRLRHVSDVCGDHPWAPFLPGDTAGAPLPGVDVGP